ncbi:MAG: hypothetical protein WBZ36_28305 [Candidatus Nitrosopolaris sp.]
MPYLANFESSFERLMILSTSLPIGAKLQPNTISSTTSIIAVMSQFVFFSYQLDSLVLNPERICVCVLVYQSPTKFSCNSVLPCLFKPNHLIGVRLLVRQAIELYKSSQLASIYARPIVLYYSYTKLARILFLSTYKLDEAKGKHGLSFRDNNVMCQKHGTFTRFHDSFNGNPTIYLKGCIFKWKDLVEQQRINRYHLILNMMKCNAIYLQEKRYKNVKFLEHELTREYIFSYAMSMLARYKVQTWGKIIEGESELVLNIQEYMTSAQYLFPNLILNQLNGREDYFYPLEPELMSFPEQEPLELDWVL